MLTQFQGLSFWTLSLFDGSVLTFSRTAIVVYQLFYKMALGSSFTAGDIVTFLSKVSLGAYVPWVIQLHIGYQSMMIQIISFSVFSRVAVGLAFGIASVLWLGFMFNDTVIEITLTLAVSYIAYFTVRYPCTSCFFYFFHCIESICENLEIHQNMSRVPYQHALLNLQQSKICSPNLRTSTPKCSNSHTRIINGWFDSVKRSPTVIICRIIAFEF